MNKLQNKAVMVWGGSGGTGFPMAKTFLEAGAKVVIIGRNLEKLTSAQANLGFENTFAVQADASVKADVEKAFRETEAEFGVPDLVVAIVGGAKDWERNFPVANDDPERLQKLAVLNESLERLKKAFVLPLKNILQVAEEIFEKKKEGWLVHLSSQVVQKDESILPGNEAYRKAKSIADAEVANLHDKYRKTGIRFTNLRPAIINTGDNSVLLNTPEKRAGAVQPEAMAQWIIDNFENPNVPSAKLFDSDVVV